MDTKMKVVIIDDEESAIDNLCFLLKKYNGVSVAGVARTGMTGLKLIQKAKPDLLFLDVELPDMSGMDVAAHLRGKVDWQMKIVFYTAYNKYLIDALRSRAFDFLLKPIDMKEMEVVMKRLLQNEEDGPDASAMRRMALDEDKPFMLFTPTGDLRFVRPSEIGYFRYVSSRKIWEVALANGSFLPLKRNTTAEQLCSFDGAFVQIHQSYIINMNYLVMVKENQCIMYPPFNNMGEELLVSKKYKKEMMEKFYQL